MRHLRLGLTIAALLTGLSAAPASPASAMPRPSAPALALLPLPVITSVSPSTGVSTGGYIITISGTALLNVIDTINLTIGGKRAAIVGIVGPGTGLRVLVPAGVAGPAEIVLTNTHGTARSTFTYTWAIKPTLRIAASVRMDTPGKVTIKGTVLDSAQKGLRAVAVTVQSRPARTKGAFTDVVGAVTDANGTLTTKLSLPSVLEFRLVVTGNIASSGVTVTPPW